MIGISKIGIYKPTKKISNLKRSQDMNADESFIKNKLGITHLSRKNDADETTDLAKKACENLFQNSSLKKEDIGCLVLVTQNPDGKGIPHSSAILHNKLGLPKSCIVFDVSLGCTGYAHGLGIIKAFMESQAISNGILVTADPYSKVINPFDRDTALLFGDAASATWLSEEPEWLLLDADYGTRSDLNYALKIDKDGILSMSGRTVFTFAATEIPESIKRLLLKSTLKLDQIDRIILHQGSRYIVDTIAKRIGMENRTKFYAGNYGNTVSSSIPIILAEEQLESCKFIIISGFGVGLSWASSILQRNN